MRLVSVSGRVAGRFSLIGESIQIPEIEEKANPPGGGKKRVKWTPMAGR
jgi:hypothetical protein